MKDYHASFLNGLLGSKTAGMGWLVEFTYNASSTLYFATYDCNLTGAGAATGNVIAVDGISSSVDMESSEWTHGRVVIRLADATIAGAATSALTNKTLSGLLSGKQFRGRAVSVWRINSSLTTVTGHTKEFTGFVSDIQMSIDGSSYDFVCDSWPEKSRKNLPTTIVNETDYPLAPKESFGQPLPIVYGTFENELDSGTYERDLIINNFHYVPGVCIDASTGQFVFAYHEVNALANTDIAIFDNSLKNYLCGVYAYTGSTVRPTVATAAPANVLLTPPASLNYWTADAVYLIPTVKGGKDDNKTTDRQHLFNQQLSGGTAKLTSTGVNQYCTQRFISLSASLEFWKTALSTDNTLWVQISSTTGSPTYKLVVWNGIAVAGDEGGSTSGTGYVSFDFGNFGDRSETDATAIATTDKWTIEELARYEYGVKIETSGDIVEITALCLQIKKPIISSASYLPYQVQERPRNNQIERDPLPPYMIGTYDQTYPHRYQINSNDVASVIARSSVFAEIKGREFGSWVDGGSRSNTKNAGDLINESSFQIESLLREELGFGDSDITVIEFDSAEAGRSNTHFSVSQFVDSYRLISELSQATFSLTFPTSGGKWRHYEIPSDPEGDATFDMSIDWGDIIPVNFYFSSLEQLCNKLTVRYHLDYGSGQYRKEAVFESSTSQGTGTRGYNHTFEKVISVPFFRFDSSSGATNYAEEFANLYVTNWKDQHGTFEFTMTNHAKFELEEGDVVKFTNFERNIGGVGGSGAGDYWGSIIAPGTIYWLIVKREPYLDSINYTAINLHQLV